MNKDTPSHSLMVVAGAIGHLARLGHGLTAADCMNHAEHLASLAHQIERAEIDARRMEHRLDEIAAEYQRPVEGPNVIPFPTRHAGHDWTARQGVVS